MSYIALDRANRLVYPTCHPVVDIPSDHLIFFKSPPLKTVVKPFLRVAGFSIRGISFH